MRMRLLLLAAAGTLAVLLFLMFRQPSGPAAAANFTAVAAGANHTCALSSGSVVQCWGRNVEGEIGDGTTTPRLRPVTISGLSYGASAIAAGDSHTCAVLVGWTSVKCWGFNGEGQIGDGTIGTNRLSPTTVCASGSGGSCVALTGIAAVGGVGAGDDFTCALTSSGGVKCWGSNRHGQLGNGTTTRSLAPVDVSGLTSGVSAIAVGGLHACALTTSGGVKCWGLNPFGQLGDGTSTGRSSPVDVSGLTSGVAALAAGNQHTCALMSGVNGNVKCWGSNSTGQLGDGTNIDKSTPVSVCAGGTQGCTAILANITKLSAGAAHTCGITLDSARNGLKCWGFDGFGQLGNGGDISLLDYVTTPVNVDGLTAPSDAAQVTAVSAGGAHTCAILTPSGAATCWGWNSDGQLGTGTTTDRSTWRTAAQDFDKDGCADYLEMQTATGSQTTGGLRNPKNFWDFFDTPDDHRTTLRYAMASSSPTLPAWVDTNSTTDPSFPTATAANPITLFVDNEKFRYDDQRLYSGYWQFHMTARAQDGTTAASHAASAPVVSGWRDGIVNGDDSNRVIARYHATGDPNSDPLGPPPPAPTYSPAFDRTYIGPNAWNLGPPDGSILIADISRVNSQYGHDCRPTPTPTP